jgi:hypothetical protein
MLGDTADDLDDPKDGFGDTADELGDPLAMPPINCPPMRYPLRTKKRSTPVHPNSAKKIGIGGIPEKAVMEYEYEPDGQGPEMVEAGKPVAGRIGKHGKNLREDLQQGTNIISFLHLAQEWLNYIFAGYEEQRGKMPDAMC